MNRKNKKRSQTQTNLWLDIAIFLLVLLVSAPQATGLAVHEWLSIAFVVPMIAHLILHWKWIVNVIKRLFSKLPGETRVNLIFNLLLFVDVVLVSFSGIVISEAALPALGITPTIDLFWVSMHDLTANLFLILTGVHIAMHWRWIVNAFNRYVWRRPSRPQPAIMTTGGK